MKQDLEHLEAAGNNRKSVFDQQLGEAHKKFEAICQDLQATRHQLEEKKKVAVDLHQREQKENEIKEDLNREVRYIREELEKQRVYIHELHHSRAGLENQIRVGV